MSIFDGMLKVILERAWSQVNPKRKTFLSACVLNTSVDPKFAQSAKLSSKPRTRTRERAKCKFQLNSGNSLEQIICSFLFLVDSEGALRAEIEHGESVLEVFRGSLAGVFGEA